MAGMGFSSAEVQSGSSVRRRRLLSGRLYGSGDRRCRSSGVRSCTETKKRIEPLQPGSLVKLITSDQTTLKDVPAYCGLAGHELV